MCKLPTTATCSECSLGSTTVQCPSSFIFVYVVGSCSVGPSMVCDAARAGTSMCELLLPAEMSRSVVEMQGGVAAIVGEELVDAV